MWLDVDLFSSVLAASIRLDERGTPSSPLLRTWLVT
jgi:hypothetical protein